MITDGDIKKLKNVFLTKEDAKKFATKDDLKKFATKDDLKKFATKDDLKKFAAKDDLKKFATKDDLGQLKNELVDEMKEWHSKIFDLVDGLALEVKDSREARSIFSYRIEDLDKRVKTLEKKANIV